jgi:hypothetical protein
MLVGLRRSAFDLDRHGVIVETPWPDQKAKGAALFRPAYADRSSLLCE